MVFVAFLAALLTVHGFTPDTWEPTINTSLLIVLALLTTHKFRQHSGRVTTTMRKADKAAKDALALRQDMEAIIKNVETIAAKNGQVLTPRKT